MTYVHPNMVDALARHELTVLVDTDQVKVYRMARPKDSAFRVQITFTPEGIAIQGDVGLGPAQTGICSRCGYGPGWLGSCKSEGYLCSKFLVQTWQREVVTDDLESRLRDARGELEDAIEGEVASRPGETREEILADTDFDEEATVKAWEEIRDAWNEDDTSESELYEMGSNHITDFWDYNVGYDYPLADAGWLCAIQRRFATLFAEANRPPKHYLMVWKHDGREDYPGCARGKDEAEARGYTTDTEDYEFREIDPAKCPVCEEQG